MNPIKRWRWWAVLVLPVVVIVLNAMGPNGWREPVAVSYTHLTLPTKA